MIRLFRFTIFLFFIIGSTFAQVYNIRCQNKIVRGQILNITWDLVHQPPADKTDNGDSYVTWVSVDNPKNHSNIGYIMFLNTHAKYFTWAVNVSPGLYYISMSKLESNHFLVLQKENDYKIINSGGHSYMCLDKSQ
ncbi:hypothetical protein F8M41_001533 [Gigaspora margarita]|uniref:Uncharacterized protein n=1 Tax=Gigaspora margarita TaxID=4874 RepID=A0A8H3XEA1_GIGMA|nr:hypothetical protein F8M41_001533 [Gigaspora margarita]